MGITITHIRAWIMSAETCYDAFFYVYEMYGVLSEHMDVIDIDTMYNVPVKYDNRTGCWLSYEN